MKLDDEYKNQCSEKLFEVLFSLVTGAVGCFFLVVSVWFGKSLLSRGLDTFADVFLTILLLISYWFLKLTYKLAFHKCTYLLSTLELKITGWFFILFIPAILLINLLNNQPPNIKELIPCTPATLYGFYALKLVKKRTEGINKSNKVY